MKLIAGQTCLFVMGIPVLPLWRQVYLRCPQCRHRVDRFEMEPFELALIDESAGKFQSPHWLFPAVGGAAMILALALIQGHGKTDPILALRANPQAGDLLVFNDRMDPLRPFHVVRINGVEGESMDLSVSSQAYQTLESAREDLQNGGLAKNDYFARQHSAMARTTFSGMDVPFGERLRAMTPK
jgi:hypothetical protein